MSMNPLDTGELFTLEMMNPNPSSSKNKDGPVYRVSFEVHRDDWDNFMEAKTSGMMLNCAMQTVPETGKPEQPEPEKPAKPEKGPHGKFAKWVYQSGVLRTPQVWAALGPESEHTAFIQDHDCVICGQRDYIEDKEGGKMLCENSHVRTADNSGTAFKPAYFSVPMCNAHHRMQHQQGYLALYSAYQRYNKNNLAVQADLVAEEMTDILKGKAIKLSEEWAKLAMYDYFDITSLTWLAPEMLAQFFELHDIPLSVPSMYLSPDMAEGA